MESILELCDDRNLECVCLDAFFSVGVRVKADVGALAQNDCTVGFYCDTLSDVGCIMTITN